MDNLVRVENNEVVVGSRQVAENFGKRHDNVLRDIENVMGLLNFEETPKMFYKTTYEHPQNHQKYTEYLMNKEGFTLLVMGFTGKVAIEWKIKYINAFNEMEKQLREAHQISPAEQMARGLLAAKELLDEANKTIAIMQPKAEFYDAVADTNNYLSMEEVAKILNIKEIGRNTLFWILRYEKVLQDGCNKNIPYQKYMKYFKLIERKYPTPDGKIKIKTQTRVNQKGVDFIRKLVTEWRNREIAV